MKTWVTEARVRELYSSLEELKNYDANHGIARRMGFASAEAMWSANPRLAVTESEEHGIMGLTEGRVQDLYSSLLELKRFDATHGVARRLGYESADAMWEANPDVPERPPQARWFGEGEPTAKEKERPQDKERYKGKGQDRNIEPGRWASHKKEMAKLSPEEQRMRRLRSEAEIDADKLIEDGEKGHEEKGTEQLVKLQRKRRAAALTKGAKVEEKYNPGGGTPYDGEDYDDGNVSPGRDRHRHVVARGNTTDDMGEPVGEEGMRRFPTCEPGQGGGDAPGCDPASTSAILLGRAGYNLWAIDMRERGQAVPSWEEGAIYDSITPETIVNQLIEDDDEDEDKESRDIEDRRRRFGKKKDTGKDKPEEKKQMKEAAATFVSQLLQEGCPECGGTGGHHTQGCPETPDDDDSRDEGEEPESERDPYEDYPHTRAPWEP